VPTQPFKRQKTLSRNCSLRIAQITARYHPSIGGVQTHVRRLSEACVDAGDEVTILTHQFGDLPAEEWIGRVRVLRFSHTVRLENFPFSWQLFRYVREHVSDFDIVHSHDYHTVVSQAPVGSDLPFIFTPHYHGTGHTALRAMLHPVYRPLGRRLFAAADAVICVSNAERSLVVSHFPEAAQKIHVFPNGTDARAWRGDRDYNPSGARIILTIGRLEPYKNVDLIIKAFAYQVANVALVIVGEGPDYPRLEQIARSFGPVGSVQFRGQVSDQELDELLRRANVVTSASCHEAFGLVVADALAAGARVVASDIPAHREVGRLAGDGAPIAFVDPTDTKKYAAAIVAALDEGPPPRGGVKLPSWADVAEHTRKLYSQACVVLFLLDFGE
jgi:glycosyltransferase involved in cell wall biosynthesis